MRIAIDLDDTLASWCTALDDQAEAAGLLQHGYQRSEKRCDFNMFKGFNVDAKPLLLDILNRPGFYRELEPIPGAVAAVKEMQEHHEVSIVSAPWLPNPECAGEKFEWVERYFGKDMVDNTVITRNKTLAKADILIDDKPHHLIHGADQAEWWQVYFTAHHNKGMPGARIDNWTDGLWRHTLASVEHHINQRKRQERA